MLTKPVVPGWLLGQLRDCQPIDRVDAKKKKKKNQKNRKEKIPIQNLFTVSVRSVLHYSCNGGQI